jgi:hypothetical protein
MSVRLQVLLEEREMRELRRAAKAEEVTVAEWVRKALRMGLRSRPQRDEARKRAAVRAAAAHAFPTGDIDQMLEQIEQGYRSGGPS